MGVRSRASRACVNEGRGRGKSEGREEGREGGREGQLTSSHVYLRPHTHTSTQDVRHEAAAGDTDGHRAPRPPFDRLCKFVLLPRSGGREGGREGGRGQGEYDDGFMSIRAVDGKECASLCLTLPVFIPSFLLPPPPSFPPSLSLSLPLHPSRCPKASPRGDLWLHLQLPCLQGRRPRLLARLHLPLLLLLSSLGRREGGREGGRV